MSPPHASLLELEQAAAEEGRRYGCEQLRQRLQAIVDEQGAICPSSGERLEDARFRALPLITTLGQITLRARYGFHRSAQRWLFAVHELWGLQSRQELSPHLQQVLGYTATERGSYKKAEAMAKTWGVPIAATTIRKHVQILGAQAQRQQIGVGTGGLAPAPPSEPYGRISRIKCGAPHFMRYVVNFVMWCGGGKTGHSLGFSHPPHHIIFCR